jgi:hypothetical protein
MTVRSQSRLLRSEPVGTVPETNVEDALQSAYPGTDFSYHRFLNLAHILTWADGPTHAQVRSAIKDYEVVLHRKVSLTAEVAGIVMSWVAVGPERADENLLWRHDIRAADVSQPCDLTPEMVQFVTVLLEYAGVRTSTRTEQPTPGKARDLEVVADTLRKHGTALLAAVGTTVSQLGPRG